MHLFGVLTIHELSFLDLGIGTLLLRGPKMLEMVVAMDASELIEVAGYQFEYGFLYGHDWALKGSAPVLREVGIPHYGVPCCWLQFGHQVFWVGCLGFPIQVANEFAKCLFEGGPLLLEFGALKYGMSVGV